MDDFASTQAQLAELRAEVQENTAILKKMRRDALIGAIVKWVIWGVLLIASYFITMQFLEPYLGVLQGGQQAGQGQDLNALLEQYKDLLGQ